MGWGGDRGSQLGVLHMRSSSGAREQIMILNVVFGCDSGSSTLHLGWTKDLITLSNGNMSLERIKGREQGKNKYTK